MRSKWIVIGSALAGTVLAAYALYKVLPRQHSNLLMIRPEGREFLADDYGVELRRAKRRGIEETIGLVRDRVIDLALQDDMLDGQDAEDIADRVIEHIRFIIEPDFDGWIELARLYVPDAGYDTEGRLDELFRERWSESVETVAGSPVAIDGIYLREVEDPMAFPNERSEPGTIIMSCANERNGGVRYPVMDGRGLRAREVLVPVMVESVDGDRLPVTLGMRFGHTSMSGTWRPVRMFMYMGPESFGLSFRSPVF